MLYPRARRWLLPWISVGILLAGGLRAEPYRDAASGVVFPDKVGGLQRGKAEPYEAEPGQRGVAVVYVSAGAPVTIYIRKLSAEATLTAAEAVKEAIAGIKQLEASGSYQHVRLTEMDESAVRTGWRGAAFSAVLDDQMVASWIYCRVVPGFLFKVRATTQHLPNDKLTADLAALLKVIDGGDERP